MSPGKSIWERRRFQSFCRATFSLPVIYFKKIIQPANMIIYSPIRVALGYQPAGEIF